MSTFSIRTALRGTHGPVLRPVMLLVVSALCAAATAAGDTWYVSTDSPADGPGTAWSNAWHTLQGALDAASSNDTVLVTNGTYLLTASVAVSNAVTLRSVNGAEATVVDGNGPVTSNRCFAVPAHNVTIEGFTIRNGLTTDGESGAGIQSLGTSMVVRACILTGNRADNVGGGLYLSGDGVLVEDCLVAGNSAASGGGLIVLENAVLRNCVITNNHARNYSGGGVYCDWGATTAALHNCFISGNSAPRGGGVEQSGGTMELRHCTISGNRADLDGGGLWINAASPADTVIRNTVVYHNEAPRGPDYLATFSDGSTLSAGHSCISPLPDGVGNTAGPPGLVTPLDPHITSGSVCIDAGDNASCFNALDVDGEPRTNGPNVDIGCDEFWAPGMTGGISVAIGVAPSNAVWSYPVEFTSLAEGRVDGYHWDFGDGQGASNACVVSYTYGATGFYDVILTAWNNEARAAATVTVHVADSFTNYVAATGGSHTPPFTSWATAADNIQAAVDANTYAGGVTLVAPGVYDRGGAVHGPSNRVAITRAMTVMAGSPDPAQTVIQGVDTGLDDTVRCAYLAEGARLVGFTLTGGSAFDSWLDGEGFGGGAFLVGGGLVSNCLVTGNASWNDGGGIACYGGGVVADCSLSGNTAANDGGGVYCDQGGRVEGCEIAGNYARWGGGAKLNYGAEMTDCLLSANQAGIAGGGAHCIGGSLLWDCEISDNEALGNDGGGVYASSGSAVWDCLVARNTATNGTRYGGGVYLGNETTLQGCTLNGNAATRGGGLYVRHADAEVRDCVIEYNFAAEYGGGVYNYRYGVLDRCTLKGNQAGSRGAGVYFYYGGSARDSLIDDNWSHFQGGGAHMYYGGSLERCTVRGNHSRSDGGGVYAYRGGAFTNCLFAHNSTRSSSGGGLYLYRAGRLENCTVVGNRSGGRAGGVYCSSGGELVNSIIYSNIAPADANYDGSGAAWTNCCTFPDPGATGCITDPPQFLYAPGQEYRLAAGSPCINAGTNRPWMAEGADLGGAPRLVDARVDIGAYEVGGLTCGFTAEPAGGVVPLAVQFTGYVAGTNTSGVYYHWDFEHDGSFDAGGPGSDTAQHLYTADGMYSVRLSVSNAAGESATCVRSNYVAALPGALHYVSRAGAHVYPFSSWATAARDIPSAVDAALPGGTVLVAGGTYNTSVQLNLQKPVTVRGVEGPGATVIDCRDLHRGFWLESGAEVSGFTITHGNGTFGTVGGGGVYFDTGGVVSNCIIAHCRASLTGGGFNMNEDGLIVDSMVRDNHSSYIGGGGRIDITGTVARCEMLDNVTDTHGGGIYMDEGGIVRDSLFSGNQAEDQYGGGLFMNYGGLARRCRFIDNTCTWLGGGAYNYQGRIENCLAVSNHGGYGGGIACGDMSGVVRNCTVVDNEASNEGGGTYQGNVANCIVYGNIATVGSNQSAGIYAYSCTTPDPGGTGNIVDDPQLVNVSAGDFRLQPGSPCIDTGGNAEMPAGRDLGGSARPLDGDADGTNTVDMGCYEFVDRGADSDGDTMTDGYEDDYGLDPTDASDATGNPDGDPHNNRQEFIAQTDPTDPADYFRILAVGNGSPPMVYFESASNRVYTMSGCSNLVDGSWAGVPGAGPRAGAGGADSMLDTNDPPSGPFYLLTVEMP